MASFCRTGGSLYSRIQFKSGAFQPKKTPQALLRCFLWWLLPDSNWGHKALQASALPTELKSLVQAYAPVSFCLISKSFDLAATLLLSKLHAVANASWIAILQGGQDPCILREITSVGKHLEKAIRKIVECGMETEHRNVDVLERYGGVRSGSLRPQYAVFAYGLADGGAEEVADEISQCHCGCTTYNHSQDGSPA